MGGLGSGHPSRANLTANEEKQQHLAVDSRFIQGVVSGINALFGEEWVRQQFADYTGSLLTFIQDKNMLLHMSRLDDRTRHVAEANLQRLTILEASSEFKDLPKHPWVWDKLATEASSVSVANPPAATAATAATAAVTAVTVAAAAVAVAGAARSTRRAGVSSASTAPRWRLSRRRPRRRGPGTGRCPAPPSAGTAAAGGSSRCRGSAV